MDCNGQIVHAAPTQEPDPVPRPQPAIKPPVSEPEPPAPSPTVVTETDNVKQARDWILAWQSLQAELPVVQPDVESVPLADTAISEILEETASASTQDPDAEARQQEVVAWITAFRERSAVPTPTAAEPAATAPIDTVEETPVAPSGDEKSFNPFAAFFAWIRSLWNAIINLFKQDSGSKPQTA